MTDKQRKDLYIEWDVTSSKVKKQITDQYQQEFGEKMSTEHWEEYLVKALNLKQSWESNGLA
ncbi:hypothetical protein [Desulfopila sp. IMCC35008]|uniref:hypothetical protein n=1 Tax=Desulfopila sp. IMCC35008 TaxID=2653858 RepID=UPI0013D729C4|nr:hypothetical protein [Desulfopila sp. IMCC35008]